MTNNGTIGDQSAVTFTGALIGDGTVTLSGNAMATFNGSVDVNQQVQLNDGLIVINDPTDFAGTVVNFGSSDAFWFPDQTVSGFAMYTGSQLTFTNGLGSTIAINMSGDMIDYPGEQMQVLSDGNAGVFIGSQFNGSLPCFAAGTRIATPAGEAAVEHLTAGDIVSLTDGSEAAITWIGHRVVDAARHPAPRSVWPVRVASDAFGPGRPHRDLFLSPDHAVFIDDVLVPVKYLINGTSIVQVAVDAVTYYHIELAEHDILLAEELPVESYLDIGDRAHFENGGEAITLFPDFSSRRPDHACLWEAWGRAPLVVHGAALERARARLRRPPAVARSRSYA